MATKRTARRLRSDAPSSTVTSKSYELSYGLPHLGAGWKWEMPAVFALPFVGCIAVLRPGPEPEDAERVVLARTPESALSTLADMGLDERYFTSTWEAYRAHYRMFAVGWVRDQTSSAANERSPRARFENVDAQGEIEAAVRVLRDPASFPSPESGGFMANSFFDGPVPFLPTSHGNWGFDQCRHDVAEVVALGDFLHHCREWLPDIANLYECYLTLRAAPPGGEVALTLPSEFTRDPSDAPDFVGRFVDIISGNAALYSKTFAALTDGRGEIQRRLRRQQLLGAWRGVLDGSTSRQVRGKALELFVATLVEDAADLHVIEKNVRTETAEVDLVLRNDVGRPFWAALSSPIVLVECKNWAKRVDAREARVLESKMKDRGRLTSVAIFVSVSGFTRPFHAHQAAMVRDGLLIVSVSAADIESLLEDTGAATLAWLEELIAKQAAGKFVPTAARRKDKAQRGREP